MLMELLETLLRRQRQPLNGLVTATDREVDNVLFWFVQRLYGGVRRRVGGEGSVDEVKD